MGRKKIKQDEQCNIENDAVIPDGANAASEAPCEGPCNGHPSAAGEQTGISEPGSRSEAEEPAAQPPETEKLTDQLIRLRADFDNYRKRTLRDRAEVCEAANRELVTELLPVLDHFQLAIKAAGEHDADAAFREGIQMIFDQLTGVLGKFGLEPLDAEGRQFDPNLFEAINHLPSNEHPEGVVIAQTRRGYLLKNTLIRPAQVIVSSGPGGSAGEEADAPANSQRSD